MPKEREMAPHSSILAWRIPWMEELGGLQSTGCKDLDMTECSLSLSLSLSGSQDVIIEFSPSNLALASAC